MNSYNSWLKILWSVFIFLLWNNLYSVQNKFFVVLTFDDGPYPKTTKQILDILSQNNVKATFFVTGRWAKKYPELIKQIDNYNQDIGIHGYKHLDMTKISVKQAQDEIKLTKTFIENIIQKPVLYFRPPAGKYNDSTIKKCKEFNLKMVLWTYYPRDYGEKDSNKILQRIKNKKFNNYEIVLLHNGLPKTVYVLDKIIKTIKSKGGNFVSLEEYIKTTGAINKTVIK